MSEFTPPCKKITRGYFLFFLKFFGNGIHEMGTARMGRDPKTSVLNKFNQIHPAHH